MGYDVTADSIIADQTGWKHTPMTQFTRSEPRITFMNDMDSAISTAPEGIGDSLAIVYFRASTNKEETEIFVQRRLVILWLDNSSQIIVFP